MRKVTPKVAVLVGLLILIIVVSSGAYAWFRATDSTTADKAIAGTISLEGKQTCRIVIDDILPGEAVDMGTSSVIYTGNRKALVQISIETIGQKSRILTKPLASNTDWKNLDPSIKAADYAVENGFNVYTDKRLKEIIGLRDAGINSDVYKGSNGNFYIMVEPNSQVNLAKIVYIAFEGEFGGLYSGIGGVLSPSRQFEQESRFHNLALKVEAVQITESAINEIWGADAMAEIQGLPIYGNLQAESTWGL